jgi:type VI secretion system protein ImpC
LLRLPYGSETDPIERFDFEEMPGDPVHGDYLWGNPALGCAYLLAQTCSGQGSGPIPGAILEIDGLPLHVYKEQGETRLKPCAEVLLSERAMEKILDKGLMPLLSIKNKDAVRLARFQSLADPATSLAGRWCSV